jgi:hypothetical protein
VVTQSVSYSFDNLFHWIACFIYLKAALVLPYLFDKNFYTDNAQLVTNYRKTQLWLRLLNYFNLAIIIFGFISVLPIIFALDIDIGIYTVSQVLLQL